MVNLKGKENSVDPKQNSFINTLIPYILTNLKTQIFIFCTKMGIGGGTSSAEKGGWDGMVPYQYHSHSPQEWSVEWSVKCGRH